MDERRQFQAQHARRRNFDDEWEGDVDMTIAVGLLVRGFSASCRGCPFSCVRPHDMRERVSCCK